MTDFYERLKPVRAVLFAVFSLFALRLFFLQVVFGDDYRIMSERNRFQIFYRQAPRGLILDGGGLPLATNIGIFNMYFNPRFKVGDVKKRSEAVAAIMGVPVQELWRAIENASRINKTQLVLGQIAPQAAFRFFEIEKDFPEFFLASESLRYYPLKEAFSHMLGYLTKIPTREHFEKLKPLGYRFDSWIGRFGLERLFENYLRGDDGAVFVEVDAKGRPLFSSPVAVKQQAAQMARLTQEPYPGQDILLTANSRLVGAAYKALQESPTGVGSAVAIDPQTGAVLALVSSPGFNPNSYVSDRGDRLAAQQNEFVRALTGVYPPGSIFKIPVSIAALEAGLDPAKKFICRGQYVLPGRTFKCWKKEGHGALGFIEGLQHSCDVYFYNIGLYSGPERLAQWAEKFSFGKKVALAEFPNLAAAGFIPTPDWKQSKKRSSWYPGDTLNFSIGQGEVLATPLQLALLMCLVANRGVAYEPYLVREIRDPFAQKILFKHPLKARPLVRVDHVSEGTWNLLEEALRLVVEAGTGRAANIAGYSIFGKTGTAQNPLGEDHSLFVCYLRSADGNPRLAVSVVIEHGGHGSSAAAPAAKKIMQEFIDMENLAPHG